jgi:flagellar hook-associated protein 1 FlgK
MSLFFGINIALKGMTAQQVAMDVASHNIANANTAGYSRQRVDLVSSAPISGLTAAGQLGSGVDVGDVTRVRNEFLDYQVRKETSSLQNQTAIADTLSQVETVFMEPSETGFNNQLESFWNNWQELSKNPESSPVRTALKEDSISLTDTLRQMHNQLIDIKDDVQMQIGLNIKDVNSIAERIARLNSQIANIKITGQSPNDLMDARDMALDKLATLGNITITDYLDANGKATGAIEVKLGTITIVDESGYKPISRDDINSSTVTEGKLAGLLQVGGDTGQSNSVQHYIDKMDTLAVAIAKAINDIHSTGKDLDGNSGEDYFVFKDAAGNEIDFSGVDWDQPFTSGLSAGNIYINSVIQEDVSKIAASKEDEIFLEGNGDIALKIAQFKDVYLEYNAANQVLHNNTTSGNTKIGMFYQSLITELGSASNEAEKKVNNQQTLVNQTTRRRESTMGVSLDEEAANIVLFQHAFNANAKVISVLDEMLNTIINGLKA